MDIFLTRGDSLTIAFSLLGENDEVFIVEEGDALYFTVKESSSRRAMVFQKTLVNGITYNKKTQEYEINIASEDTDELPYCRLVYDIELVINREDTRIVKTVVKGDLTITEEVTHKENEV